MASVTKGQGPTGSSVVIVNVTSPAAISAAEGVYTVVGSEASRNAPLPEVVHRIVAADPPKTPRVLKVVPSQIVSSTPADTVAIGSIVNVIKPAAGTHGPAPSGSLEVIVKSTVPAVISAADGV